MARDPEKILQHLLYTAFKDFSLDDFTLNLAKFLVEYIPIVTLGLRKFENKRIYTLSYYSFNTLLSPPPKVVELSDALLQELYMHPSVSGYKYAPRILSAQEDGPYGKVHRKIFREDESSISFPLIIDDFLTSSIYFSISTTGIGKYNEDHLDFLEKIRAPLAAAVTHVLENGAAAVPASPAGGRRRSSEPAAPVPHAKESASSIPTLDEMIKTHILRTLDLTQGRVSGPRGAARLLGVPSSTLSSKIRRLGITVQRGKND